MMHPSTFEYLKPTDAQIERMAKVRAAAKAFNDVLEAELPDGPDKTFVILQHQANVPQCPLPERSWQPTDLAYLAGFMDGEGSVTIFRWGKRDQLRLDVYNTNRAVLDWIREVFGGRVHAVGQRSNQGLKQGLKQEYTWTAGPQQAAFILASLLPYLKIKHEQAELFIDYAATSRGRCGRAIPANVALFRAAAIERIQFLNKRGVAITRQPDGTPR